MYRGKIKPPRQHIPEDGRPSHVYAQSAMDVPVTTRDVPNTQRSFSTPNVSISSSRKGVVPHSVDQQPPQSYAEPSYTTRADEFRIANHLSQTGSSPLEAPVSENLISNYSQASHTNGAINSSDRYALPPNSQYSSHLSSQQWYTSLSQYRPSQGTENARNADSSSIDSIPCSNTLHTLENKRPQVSPENYSSVLDQRLVAAWNNGEYSGPSAESYWSFRNSSHQHIDADSVSPRSSRCERGLSKIAREGCEDSSGIGNQEPSGASRTTTYTESTLSTDSGSSSSVSDDDGTSRRRLPSQSGYDLNTGINLQRSYQRYKKQKLSNDVGCEFSSFLAQRLIGEIGKCVPMRCTRVARWPTTQS